MAEFKSIEQQPEDIVGWLFGQLNQDEILYWDHDESENTIFLNERMDNILFV